MVELQEGALCVCVCVFTYKTAIKQRQPLYGEGFHRTHCRRVHDSTYNCYHCLTKAAVIKSSEKRLSLPSYTLSCVYDNTMYDGIVHAERQQPTFIVLAFFKPSSRRHSLHFLRSQLLVPAGPASSPGSGTRPVVGNLCSRAHTKNGKVYKVFQSGFLG